MNPASGLQVLFILIAVGCAHRETLAQCPTTPRTAAPFANRESYLTLLGMNATSTMKDVRSLLGDPERIESHPDGWTTLIYLNEALNVTIYDEADRVSGVQLTNRYALQSQRFPQEEINKANPLGRSAQELLDLLGPPDHAEGISFGVYSYALGETYQELGDPRLGKLGYLMFSCSPYNQCYCDEIWISWSPNLEQH